MKQTIFSVFLAVVFLGTVASSALAGFDEGLVAYKRGDYATALEEWLPVAEQGDAFAQSYLGDMYNFGEGVAQDLANAAKWYRKAAEQGFSPPPILPRFNVQAW